MRITALIGKKVLDDGANEIGKVEELDVNLKDNCINNILINVSDRTRRKELLNVTTDMVEAVGDYLLLNVLLSDLIGTPKEEKTIEDVEIVDPESLDTD